MNTKSFLCCVIASAFMLSITAFCNDSTEESVTVLFNQKAYSGTLKRSESADTFYPDDTDEKDFTITGKWAKTAFKGACIVTYEDGTTWEVNYKNRLLSGDVLINNTDGSSTTCTFNSGKPYGKISFFESDGSLADVDWYYQCTPIRTLVKQSVSVSYSELIDSPYDYYDMPIFITGTILSIYETPSRQFVTLSDSGNHVYIFSYHNNKTNRYQPANIPNLTLGDTVTVYGYYNGLKKMENELLYEHLAGYMTDIDTFRNHLITNEFLSSVKNISAVKADPTLSNEFPFITAFYAESLDTYPIADPINLRDDYKEICQNPLYYQNEPVSVAGFVIYQSYNKSGDDTILTLLLRELETGNVYTATKKVDSKTDYLNKPVLCTGFLNGNGKIPYYDISKEQLGYAIYPNMTAKIIKDIS